MSFANANILAAKAFTETIHTDTYDFISPKNADLSGKSVFISGASKGIGRAAALSYAAAGCSKIAIAARSDLTSLEREIKEAAAAAQHKQAPKVVSLVLDVTSEDSVKAAAETVAREFDGVLDVLINNAGYLESFKSVVDTDPTEWWKTWEVNVKGTYLCSKYLIPLLLKSTTKTNILVSSYGALATWEGSSAYQTTKLAVGLFPLTPEQRTRAMKESRLLTPSQVSRLAEFWDVEYGKQGLVCFALHPGSVPTELAHGMPQEAHVILSDTVELPADTMLWLGKKHRPWLSGRWISADWDMAQLEAKKDEIVSRDILKFRLTL